jgi:hypothetical protein
LAEQWTENPRVGGSIPPPATVAMRGTKTGSIMAEFTVNPKRFDPYKNFKFRVKWDGKYVAGVSKISGLKRTTEVIHHREGGDPSR